MMMSAADLLTAEVNVRPERRLDGTNLFSAGVKVEMGTIVMHSTVPFNLLLSLVTSIDYLKTRRADVAATSHYDCHGYDKPTVS